MSTASCESVLTASIAPAPTRPARSRNTLYALIEAFPLPCAVFAAEDGKDEALLANAAFRDEFGYPGGRADFDAGFESLNEGPDGTECYAPRSRRWYRLVWRSVRWKSGQRCNIVFVSNTSDEIEALRQHKAQQDRLLFTSRMLSVGEMATTLAHELNQPLGAIINYLSTCTGLIERGDGSNPRLCQGIALARSQAEHASAVIARLREFVRTRNPRREPHRLEVLAQTVVELLRLEAEQHQVRILTDLSKSLPRVVADRVMIEQVLLNLVKNAVDAMRNTPSANREILITARIDLDSMVEVRVRDRGAGIGSDFTERMFAPLFSTKSEGLGMGLAICRSIVEFHEGRLFAEPNADGGSTFAFTLPAEPV